MLRAVIRRGGARNASARAQSRGGGLGTVAFLARELAATMRVGFAAGSGWRKRVHSAKHECHDAVILVHGLMATAGAFGALVGFLRREIHADVHTFTFLPGSTLEGISSRIDEIARACGRPERLHVIGHSLGGLAARWYVQEHVHDPRIVQTISIATPFRGAFVGDLFPDVVRGLVMPVRTELARILDAAPRHLARVPHLSIVAENDQLIRPADAVLPGAPTFTLHDTGHNGALFNRRLHEVVAREIVRRGAAVHRR